MRRANYTKEEKKVFNAHVRAIKKKFPLAFIDTISKRTGKTRNVIKNVLSGRTVNYEVLDAMKLFVEEKKSHVEKLKAELIK